MTKCDVWFEAVWLQQEHVEYKTLADLFSASMKLTEGNAPHKPVQAEKHEHDLMLI